MRIVITGATGLIGRALCKKLYPDYEIIALSRHPEKSRFSQNITVVQWDAHSPDTLAVYIDGALAVINLAGASIASGRWTQAKKQRILQSRLNVTNAVVKAIASAKHKPDILIQASAIGYYGFDCPDGADEITGAGSGYLAEVCTKWEQSSKPVEQFGTRRVIIRTGLVLSSNGGALPRLVTPFKFFLGGYPGSGEQWVSWITIDDEVAAIKFLLENKQLSGVFNLASPNTVTMRQLCKTIGRILKRPCWLPIPALALRLTFGKMADETILADQKVIPSRLLKSGFKFGYQNIADAMDYVLKKRRKMSLADYFGNTEGLGVLATSDAEGNVDLALYARPYIININEQTIAFSMLERRSYNNIQSNPKAAYIFIEDGESYKGTRLYLIKTGEETDAERIKQIKEQHKKRYSTESAGKHLVYFKITETRPLVGGQ